jgi:hypothetical protein
MIEKYNDETFQAYVILNAELSKEKRNEIRKFITNKKIIDLLHFYENSILENQILMYKDQNHNINKYWEEFDYKIKIEIEKISEINKKILYY